MTRGGRIAGLAVIVAIGVVTALLLWRRGSPDSPHDELAYVISVTDTSRIVMPDTVRRGVRFEIAFDTFGGGCVRTMSSSAVVASQANVVVEPFDHHDGKATCPADTLRIHHTAWVRFDYPGTASVRVAGRKPQRWPAMHSGLVEVARSVVVR